MLYFARTTQANAREIRLLHHGGTCRAFEARGRGDPCAVLANAQMV